jgi:hypothetical protein
MKKILRGYVLLLLILTGSKSFSTTCDSLVIHGSTVSTYRDGLLFSDDTGNYMYDSLGRLIGINRYDSTKTVYLYSASGADSAFINYGYNGQSTFFSSGQIFLNDTNGNLFVSYDLTYDTVNLNWDTTYVYYYFYSPDSLTQSDTIYTYPGNQPIVYQNTIRDSSGRVISTTTHAFANWSTTTYTYDVNCPDRVSYSNSSSTTAGPFGSTTITESYWVYDSLCRPLYEIDSSSYTTSASTDHFYSLAYYYYADCNNIVVTGSDTVCTHQSYSINVNVYGGTGPYTYSWTGDSLSANNISNPVAYVDSVNTYYLTVSDSIGNAAQFSQTALVDSFSYIVTNASCNSCNDGTITISPVGVQSNLTYTVSPNSGVWNGNMLTGLSPGNYFVCSNYYSCSYCDSIRILSPNGIEESAADNLIHVFPNPVSEKIFIRLEAAYFITATGWQLSDLSGRIIKRGRITQPEFTVSADDISGGVYFLSVSVESNCVKKILVQ